MRLQPQALVDELFANFGQLKSLRMPKKMDGNHRGFAFVELSSYDEALRAVRELDGADIAGRNVKMQMQGEGKGKAQQGNGAQNIPTTYPEMFQFNMAVMGFGDRRWLSEVLACFDNIVRVDIEDEEIKAMNSNEKEKVALKRVVKARGQIEQWLD